MGFRINTNIAAMNAHRNSANTNLKLDKSLQSLSSGLRINTAADDASGLAIANSLRAQASGLGQAINNANDGIGVVQTADGALDEYENIINIVRTKAIQAASDGQNEDSRSAIQRDISKLIEEAQNIATTTSFNGQKLLDGTFQNRAFHIGAYKDETVSVSIASTQTDAIGMHVNTEGKGGANSGVVNAAADLKTAALAFDDKFSINGVLTGVSSAASEESGDNLIGHSAGSAWAKATAINSVETATGVQAKAQTIVTGENVAGGKIIAGDLIINGTDIGDVNVDVSDASNSLMNAINNKSEDTGVIATHDGAKIILTANDGSEIKISTINQSQVATGLGLIASDGDQYNSGKLTLSSEKSVEVQEGATGFSGFGAGANDLFSVSTGHPVGESDVTTREGAENTILTMDHALTALDQIRSDIGSTQNQLESTIRNISVTQVNVAAAESQIRDVDFAAESANFSKNNILAQSGSFAMSQANAVQQNVLKLLQ
ncbi:MAG: flagellin [Sulfurimonas sp.]|jgi:flagellin